MDFRSLKPYLEPYVVKKDAPSKDYDKDNISNILENLTKAIDNFDLDKADECMKELTSYKLNDELTNMVKDLSSFVANLDYDQAAEVSKKINSLL